jgi:hypothetical protein
VGYKLPTRPARIDPKDLACGFRRNVVSLLEQACTESTADETVMLAQWLLKEGSSLNDGQDKPGGWFGESGEVSPAGELRRIGSQTALSEDGS